MMGVVGRLTLLISCLSLHPKKKPSVQVNGRSTGRSWTLVDFRSASVFGLFGILYFTVSVETCVLSSIGSSCFKCGSSLSKFKDDGALADGIVVLEQRELSQSVSSSGSGDTVSCSETS